MGERDSRNPRRTPRPAAPGPTAKPVAQTPTPPAKLAVTTRPAVTRMPAALRSATPQGQKPASGRLISRTATLDDPLTTSLLAEVTRRSKTVEVAPEQVEQARDLEPDDGDPDDSI